MVRMSNVSSFSRNYNQHFFFFFSSFSTPTLPLLKFIWFSQAAKTESWFAYHYLRPQEIKSCTFLFCLNFLLSLLYLMSSLPFYIITSLFYLILHPCLYTVTANYNFIPNDSEISSVHSFLFPTFSASMQMNSWFDCVLGTYEGLDLNKM